MFSKGETVIIADTFERGTITDIHDGTYLVKVGEIVKEVSEFDLIPDDLDDYFDDYYEEDDDFSDLDVYRNMNQNYY